MSKYQPINTDDIYYHRSIRLAGILALGTLVFGSAAYADTKQSDTTGQVVLQSAPTTKSLEKTTEYLCIWQGIEERTGPIILAQASSSDEPSGDEAIFATKEQGEAFFVEWAAAFNQQNYEKFKSLYHPSATVTYEGGRKIGTIDDFIRYAKEVDRRFIGKDRPQVSIIAVKKVEDARGKAIYDVTTTTYPSPPVEGRFTFEFLNGKRLISSYEHIKH